MIRFHSAPPAPPPRAAMVLATGYYPLTAAYLSAEARGDIDLLTDVRTVICDVRDGRDHSEIGFTYARGVDLPIVDAAEKLFATALRRSCIWHPEPWR